MPRPDPTRPDLASVRAALLIAAEVVETQGPAYLPLFLRVEEEERRLAGERSALDRARALTQAAQEWRAA